MPASHSKRRDERTEAAREGEGVSLSRECRIRCTPADVYAFWHEPENLASLVRGPLTITRKSDRESRWSVAGPLGLHVEWDAVIEEDEPPHRMAWRSRAGAGIANTGEVRFEPIGAGTTRVSVSLRYDPPGGPLGAAVARLGADAIGRKLEEALQNLKERMEKPRPG